LYNTADYYNKNADKFIKETINLDVEGLYQPFLQWITSKSTILDAGAGSGRDSLYLMNKGFGVISIDPLAEDLADVDHFFPHMLQSELNVNLDGIWNLVLACKSCNRGVNGKFARVPQVKYLERLHKRNKFMINSHHPLRETLINQCGRTEIESANFLSEIDKLGINKLIHRWQPVSEFEAVF